jgi:hypothetical protein
MEENVQSKHKHTTFIPATTNQKYAKNNIKY